MPLRVTAIGPSTVVRMATRFLLDRSGLLAAVLWEEATIKHLVQGHVAYHSAFYTRAMTTDFDEATRPSQAPRFGFTEGQCDSLALFDQYRLLSAQVLEQRDRAPVIEPEEHTEDGAPTAAEAAPQRPRFLNADALAELAAQHRSTLASFPQHSADGLTRWWNPMVTATPHCAPSVCSQPSQALTPKGLRQLEILKREVSSFRTVATEQRVLSRTATHSFRF